MTEHAVVITGGGPTGVMLAGEFGVGRRGRRDCRAARQPGPSWLARNHIERVLAGWVGELSVPIYRGREVTGLPRTTPAWTSSCRTACRCGRNISPGATGDAAWSVRQPASSFRGWDPTTSSLITEVELDGEPEWGIHRDALGTHALGRVEYEIRDGEVVYGDSGPVGAMVTEGHVGSAGEPTLRDLSEALIAVYGTDYGVHSPTWISRFHRYDPAGRGLSRRTGPAGRRRGSFRYLARSLLPLPC